MTAEMDVLSDVLRAIRLQGALFFNGEFSAPSCFYSPQSVEVVPALAPKAECLIIYHFLTEGAAYVRLSDGSREELAAGEIVVLPHGDAHFMGNGLPERPVDARQILAKNLQGGLKFARYGGGGEATRFVCGYMACDSRLAGTLLGTLPRLLKVRITGDPSGKWLADSIRFSVGEGAAHESGKDLITSKLAEVLFVETLRRYVNSLPPEHKGWFAGTRDPHVGRALALLHQDPIKPWTLVDLAYQVGVSRTVLAERFRYLLGEPPMAYLTGWRLKLAAEMLRTGDNTIADIAAAIGYGSEAAFSRAFSREFQCPPAKFRREQQSTVSYVTH
jgi:AraC-like DNA-binding protein